MILDYIEEEIDDEDESLYSRNANQYPQTDPPEKHLSKAIKAYDNYKYERCLKYIKDYEKSLQRQGVKPPYSNNNLTIKQRVLILSYKAYCKKFLKHYESAKEYFADLIELMKEGEPARMHIFSILAACQLLLCNRG